MNDEQAQANLQLALAWIDAMHRGESRDHARRAEELAEAGLDRRRPYAPMSRRQSTKTPAHAVR